MLDCLAEHPQRCGSSAVLVTARTGEQVYVGDLFVPILCGRNDDLRPRPKILRDNCGLGLRLVPSLIKKMFRNTFPARVAEFAGRASYARRRCGTNGQVV